MRIDAYLKTKNSSLDSLIDCANINAYDVGTDFMPKGETWNAAVYDDVLQAFGSYVGKKKTVLGFEPGEQMADGIW